MWARKEYMFLIVSSIMTIALSANSPATNPNGSNRQAGSATGIVSLISSMIPGAIGNVLPMVLLFGLGALMVPALGLGLLLREGRRSEPYYQYRSFPSFKINTAAIIDGASDVLERVMKALDNVDNKYN
ncbi:uncharacterized protein LOC128391847 [Panonychus citri]|uniref:uncharacterized protein LOC128391847 n=1 Tax=Panonychus citri TaxID=50023 RepID=UPI002307A2BA|nr:uncharacterized protein LOC128391847 [Panonychus citri]